MKDMFFNVYMTQDYKIIKDSTTKIIELDGRKIRNLNELYQVLRQELVFGDSFGLNLDALYDSLSDLSWLPFQKIVLKFINTEELLEEETTDTIYEVFDVFNDASSSINNEPLFGSSERELSYYFEQSNRIEDLLDQSFLIWGHVG